MPEVEQAVRVREGEVPEPLEEPRAHLRGGVLEASMLFEIREEKKKDLLPEPACARETRAACRCCAR